MRLELKGLCLHSHVSQSLPVSTLTAMSCGTGLHKCSTIVPSFKILPSARFEFHFNNTLIYFKPYSGIFFLTKTIAYYKQEHAYTHAIGKCHWKDQQTVVPECLSSQLRTFKFKSYNDFGCEVQFAKYIMQNSKVLQNMTMTVDKHQMLETFSLRTVFFTLTQHLRRSKTWRLLYDFLSVMFVITSAVRIVNYNRDRFNANCGCCKIK